MVYIIVETSGRNDRNVQEKPVHSQETPKISAGFDETTRVGAGPIAGSLPLSGVQSTMPLCMMVMSGIREDRK